MKTDREYILQGKKPVEEHDLMKWAEWFETANRHVASDMIGKIHVSTIFLGLDHSFAFGKKHRPILFETMIFGGKHDGYQERYFTWEEAEKGHKKAVKLVRSNLQYE